MPADNPIPPATADKLAADFPPGTRHKAKVDIALPLIGNGMSPTAVFVQLREKFPDASDKEIEGVIEWCVRRNPTPSQGGGNGQWHPIHRSYTRPAEPEPPKRTPPQQCDWWTSGSRETPCDIVSASPIPVPEHSGEAAALLFGSLFRLEDNLNIVTEFFLDDKKEKAKPHGAGEILQRDEWIVHFRDHGIPQSQAGSWMRINPCNWMGTGKNGCVTDEDISAFRYLLLESDTLPIGIQLALYRRLPLPIAAIIMSGGHSAHAWIKLDSINAEKYDADAKRIFAALEPFGFDQANKNPSRLCRTPGAVRVIGAEQGGEQRVLWINPNCNALTDASLSLFEDSLKLPAIEDRPLRRIVAAALPRYRELLANAGRLGVPYGVAELDNISGGMKPGQTIAAAGATGGGKSTYALHVIDHALRNRKGVLLCSLEMDKEEVFDLLVSSRFDIDRNKFNHGRFVDYDFEIMESRLPEFNDLPLYIEDTPMMTADQIRLRVMQLKTAGKIDLAVIDYIQFVNPEWTKDNREQQVALISHKLRALARETRVPMLILSQLNDEGKLRESRVISHNANVVLLIVVQEDIMQVNVIKGRGIPMGTHKLNFNRRFARLEPTEVRVDESDLAPTQPPLPVSNDP